jgi:hypothetical protein
MHAVTHLYTRPGAAEGEQGRREVDAALAKLSAELELPHVIRIMGGHNSRIKVPESTPEETWTAMDRAVADWPDMFLPRPID